jgi:ABC-type sugar transport system ATPase subunit
MAGRPVETIFPPKGGHTGDVVLRVQGLHGRRLRDVSFDLHAGEVVGIAGLAGSGRSEVLRLIAGAQRMGPGRLTLHGTDHRPRSVGHAHRAGVALVPQERRTEGLVPDSVERNANLTTTGRHTLAGTVVSKKAARRHAHDLAELLRIRRHSLDQAVLTLSGGNQQKVVLAKFLALGPSVLLLDEPTRGVDVATKGEIYHLVRERAREGLGVVVVSSELTELLGLADRIVVLHEGAVSGVFHTADVTEDDVLHACYGRPSSAPDGNHLAHGTHTPDGNHIHEERP